MKSLQNIDYNKALWYSVTNNFSQIINYVKFPIYNNSLNVIWLRQIRTNVHQMTLSGQVKAYGCLASTGCFFISWMTFFILKDSTNVTLKA